MFSFLTSRSAKSAMPGFAAVLAGWAGLLVVLATGGAALAEEAAAPVLDSGDTAWLLTSSALVMFMTPGLALFYSGLVRRKNVLSSCMHSFVALAVIGVQWMVIGYSLAFGEGNSWIGDFSAERMKFSAYVLFLVLWATLVYDPVAHWVWGGGWIQKMGALDFAGGTVVHLSSGVSALAMAMLLGKRLGYPNEPFIPHNLTLTLLGLAMLWVGWFGFNAGSALAANASACLAFTTTMIASAAAAFSWMMMEWMLHRKPSALGIASGSLAGLVVITPAAGFVTPTWSLVLGLSAGIICYYGIRIKTKLGFDDSLDVVGIHGVGGAWGAIGTGLFVTVGGEGLISGNPVQVWTQFVSVAVVGVYAFGLTYAIGYLLDKTIGLRVEEDEEVIGLDRELHGETGYSL